MSKQWRFDGENYWLRSWKPHLQKRMFEQGGARFNYFQEIPPSWDPPFNRVWPDDSESKAKAHMYALHLNEEYPAQVMDRYDPFGE